MISIHALREEGDGVIDGNNAVSYEISIHALREEGDQSGCCRHLPAQNFYPRPPRGGRPGQQGKRRPLLRISIHALREEGDRVELLETVAVPAISIHALREEGDRTIPVFSPGV